MGGSPPSAPTVVMPAPTAPTTYQSVVPLESYQQAADYVKRLTEKTKEIEKQTYREVGTPAEIGARQAGRRALESGAYAASIPSGDKYLSETTGRTDQFKSFKEGAEALTGQAIKDYGKALSFADEVPKSEEWETPSWATSTIPEGMPGYKAPEREKSPQEITAEKQEALKQFNLDTRLNQQKERVEALKKRREAAATAKAARQAAAAAKRQAAQERRQARAKR